VYSILLETAGYWNAAFTRQGPLVRSQYRPPIKTARYERVRRIPILSGGPTGGPLKSSHRGRSALSGRRTAVSRRMGGTGGQCTYRRRTVGLATQPSLSLKRAPAPKTFLPQMAMGVWLSSCSSLTDTGGSFGVSGVVGPNLRLPPPSPDFIVGGAVSSVPEPGCSRCSD
jgi:hypothetical protein